MKLSEQAESHRSEAVRLLDMLIKTPNGYSSDMAKDIVENILKAAILEIAALVKQSSPT